MGATHSTRRDNDSYRIVVTDDDMVVEGLLGFTKSFKTEPIASEMDKILNESLPAKEKLARFEAFCKAICVENTFQELLLAVFANITAEQGCRVFFEENSKCTRIFNDIDNNILLGESIEQTAINEWANMACYMDECASSLRALVKFASPEVKGVLWRNADNIEALTVLREYASEAINDTNEMGRTALHEAKNLSLLSSLCEVPGIDLNAQDAFGRTPLHLLALSEDQVEKFSATQFTLSLDVAIASQKYCSKAMKILIGCGADKESRDYLGYTPLLCAAMSGNTAGVRTLVQLGANVNAGSEAGVTPLLVAAMHHFYGQVRYPIIEALVLAGADVNKCCTVGETTLYTAMQALASNRPSFSFVSGDSASPWEKLLSNSKRIQNLLRCIKLLITYGADIYGVADASPLALAKTISVELAEIMIAESSRVDAESKALFVEKPSASAYSIAQLQPGVLSSTTVEPRAEDLPSKVP